VLLTSTDKTLFSFFTKSLNRQTIVLKKGTIKKLGKGLKKDKN